jgi:hypothetical protein
MSRSEEIRVQLEELKARKQGRSKEAYALREELRGLESPPSQEVEVAATVEPGAAAEVPESVFESDEYRFMEKCCQEAQLPRGTSAGMAMLLYNEMAAKRMAWIIMREVIQEVGVGQPTWPQWSTLGRNNATGEKNEDYEARQKYEIAKNAALRQMEIDRLQREREEAAARGNRVVSSSPLDQLKENVAAAIRADFASRPEPEMGKAAAPSATE